jgi:O-Antigen ligase
MTWLAIIAGLSLFSGIDQQVAGVIVRPFDFLTAIMVITLIAKVLARGSLRVPGGFIWLLPFIVISVWSAATLSFGNGVREGLQMCIVLAFALSLANADDPCPRGSQWVLLFCVMWALLLFNAGWHINEGYITGWKKLYALKHTISVTILLTVIWIARRDFRASLLQLLIFGLLGGVVIMSGERKSLLVYGFALMVLMRGIGWKRSLQVLVAPVAFGVIAFVFFADDYMMRQVASLTLTTGYTPAGQPESISNQARAFAFDTGLSLFLSSPIVGVGTNGFEIIINRLYSFYPGYLLKSIHGEFFRVLVENGVLGFAAYMAVWIASIARTIRVARDMKWSGRLSAGEARNYLRIYAVFVFTSAAVCGLEASGTEIFIFLVLVSLWPDLSRFAFRQQATDARRMPSSLELGRT